jgi:hypothetical protein
LLIEMVHRWRDHQLVIRWMQKLFSYLVSWFFYLTLIREGSLLHKAQQQRIAAWCRS